MYNYSLSPSKVHRDDHKSRGGPVSLDNLPAVPDKRSSESLFDSIGDASGSQKVFNLYDNIDSLLRFDKEGEDESGGAQQAGAGGRTRDDFHVRMEEVEETMKTLALPRFKIPDRPLKLAENRSQ